MSYFSESDCGEYMCQITSQIMFGGLHIFLKSWVLGIRFVQAKIQIF